MQWPPNFLPGTRDGEDPGRALWWACFYFPPSPLFLIQTLPPFSCLFYALELPSPPFPFSLLFLLAPQFHPGCTGHGQTHTHLDSWFTHTSGPLSHRRHTSPCCGLETWGRVVHGRLMGSQRNPRARGQGLSSEAQEPLY